MKINITKYKCDGCAVISEETQNDRIPDGWSKLSITHTDKGFTPDRHFCPKCHQSLKEKFGK